MVTANVSKPVVAADIPWTLVLLTIATGMVDAVSYLRLGHVFVANMTGNVVFLGFAAAGSREVSALGAIVAMIAFLVGALVGGRLTLQSRNNNHLVFMATIIKTILALFALFSVAITSVQAGTLAGFRLIAILAVAMGVQNGVVRKVNTPDFTTTVLTLTITGIAADLGGASDPKLVRRLISVASMFLGALIGGVLVLHAGMTYALIGICVVFALTSLVVWLRRGQEKP